MSFSSLRINKILDTKAFTDKNSNVAKMAKFVFDRLESIVGKGENAGIQHFLHFPQCFQKACFSGFLKVGSYGKGLTLYQTTKSWSIPN